MAEQNGQDGGDHTDNCASSLEELQVLISKQQYEEAVEPLRTRIGADLTGSDPERRLLNRALRALGRYSEALEVTVSVRTKTHDDLIDRALTLWCLNRNPEALEILRASILMRESARAYLVSALIEINGQNVQLLSQDERVPLITSLGKAIQLEDCPERAFILLDDLIPSYSDSGPKERQNVLERGISQHTNSKELRVRLSWLYLNSFQSPERAVEVLVPVLEMATLDADDLWLAHRAFLEIGKFDQAAEFLAKVSPHSAKGVSIRKVLGDTYLKAGEFQKAITQFEQEIAEGSSEAKATALLSRAEAFLLQKRPSEAAQDVEKSVALCFEHEITFSSYGEIEISPENPVFYDYSNSLRYVCEAFLKEADLSPISKTSETFGRLSYLYYKLLDGSADREQQDLSQWLLKAEALAKHPMIYSDLSSYYQQQGIHEKGIFYRLGYATWRFNEDQERKTEFRPTFAKYEFCEPFTKKKLGKKVAQTIHKNIFGQLETADLSEELKRVVIVPFLRGSWIDALHELELYKEAKQASAFALEYEPKNTNLLWHDAYAAHCLKDLEQAEESYRDLLEIQPNNSSALHNLSLIVEQSGNIEEAMDLSEKALAARPDDENFKKRHQSFEKVRIYRARAQSELSEPQVFEDLSLRQRLFLATVLRLCLSEDKKTIRPVSECDGRLAPTFEYQEAILIRLWTDSILVVDPKSKPSALHLNEKKERSIVLVDVTWILNLVSSEGLAQEQMLQSFLNPKPVTDDEIDEAIELWKEVALEESLEYFQYRKEKVDLPIDIGDKTRDYFTELLNSYSVGQMYTIIYKAISLAVTMQREQRLPNKHAANIASSHCKKYGEKAIAQGWGDLYTCRRDFNCPQSIVSQILFQPMMEIGEAGFERRPGLLSGLRFELKNDAASSSGVSDTDSAPSEA